MNCALFLGFFFFYFFNQCFKPKTVFVARNFRPIVLSLGFLIFLFNKKLKNITRMLILNGLDVLGRAGKPYHYVWAPGPLPPLCFFCFSLFFVLTPGPVWAQWFIIECLVGQVRKTKQICELCEEVHPRVP